MMHLECYRESSNYAKQRGKKFYCPYCRAELPENTGKIKEIAPEKKEAVSINEAFGLTASEVEMARKKSNDGSQALPVEPENVDVEVP
jgi:hypothetical protein